MPITVDDPFVRATLSRLVQINSVNPRLDPQAPGESDIAEYLANVMAGLGLSVRTYEPEPGRVSVVGRRSGSGGGRSLMLNAHLDTVGVAGMADPFSAAVRDGRLYGRGSYDMKGALAACLGAVKALGDGAVELQGDLVVAAVADEEYASLGTSDLLRHVRTDGAVVTEPSQLDICLAHKGYVWLKVWTEGRAAHGSRFEEGVDANVRMGRVLGELEKLGARLVGGRSHPLVGPGSLHAALLRGGTGISTYADRCQLEIERRTIPGETVEDVEREVSQILDCLRAADATFRASMETFFAREPFEVRPDAPVVQAVERGAERVLGRRPRRVGDTPWMDAALLQTAGVETVVMGPSGAGAHAVEEWVDLHSVNQLAAILAETAVEYCGR